jgi:hypothetical protein
MAVPFQGRVQRFPTDRGVVLVRHDRPDWQKYEGRKLPVQPSARSTTRQIVAALAVAVMPCTALMAALTGGTGVAVGAGVIAGLFTGSLVGSAIARHAGRAGLTPDDQERLESSSFKKWFPAAAVGGALLCGYLASPWLGVSASLLGMGLSINEFRHEMKSGQC